MVVKASVVRSDVAGEVGPHVAVCDLCAHALRHHWQRALGERVSATSPAVARTYVLVPRLPKDREELDVSSYEVLTGLDGRLPSVPFARDAGALCASLAQRFGLATWPETLRKFYVGYDGSGDFAEVYLAWAWGQVVGPQVSFSQVWTTFGDLLGEATPEAGFVLGVKAAFESSVLWHREHAPEDNRVFVRLREPAMRCLRYLTAEDPEALGEDEAMLDLCKQAVTPEERAVLDLVEASRAKVAEEAALEAEAETGEADTDTGIDAGASDDDDAEGASDEEQPPLPGFARAGGLKRDD